MYTYIHKYVPYIGRPTRRSTCVTVITVSASLEMQVMEQAARKIQAAAPQVGGLQGYALLQWRAWSRDDDDCFYHYK